MFHYKLQPISFKFYHDNNNLCFRYLNVLLKQVSQGHIVYSPLHKAFVSLPTEGALPYHAEDYADLMGARFLQYYDCLQ